MTIGSINSEEEPGKKQLMRLQLTRAVSLRNIFSRHELQLAKISGNSPRR